jgi:hypothetical protein
MLHLGILCVGSFLGSLAGTIAHRRWWSGDRREIHTDEHDALVRTAATVSLNGKVIAESVTKAAACGPGGRQ